MLEVFKRQSVINLICYTLLALHSSAYDQLLPVFMLVPKTHLPIHQSLPTHPHRTTPHTSTSPFNPSHLTNTHRYTPRADPTSPVSLPFKFSGGFSLSPGRIGTLFTLYGFIGCAIQFLIFPPVARRFGVLNCFKVCGAVFPLIWFATPYTALLASPLTQQVVMFSIMIVKCFVVIFAFPCSVILLTNSAVSLRILGTLNGFAVSISAIGRAIGPAIGGAAYSWGLETGYMITAWWILGTVAALGAIPIWFLEEMEGFSTSGEEEDEDEESEDGGDEGLENIVEDREGEILAGDEVLEFESEDEAIETVDGAGLARVSSGKSVNEQSRKRASVDGSRDLLGSLGASASASGSGSGSGKRNSLDARNSFSRLERRMSSPLGLRGGSVGPGGGRRLSNGLAASNVGLGTGGTSFA